MSKNIVKYKSINYNKVLSDGLKVIDSSAISLARENNIPMVVFSIHKKNSFQLATKGYGDFTLISSEGGKSA